MAAEEDKAPFKVTIKLEVHDMEEVESLIEQMQQIVVSEGMSIDGKISYDTPFTWRRPGADARRARITRSTPVDQFLNSIGG